MSNGTEAQTRPRVFISYSHDSDAHRQRVLELSERLRKDGIDADLDQYVKGTPSEKWPRWMLNRLDWAKFVLLVCTATYYRRFRGHEEPGKGQGVDWEGAVITDEIYANHSATLKFVPVLFDQEDKKTIPEPVRGHSFYCLSSETDYQKLYDFLLGQSGTEPRPLGQLKRKACERAQPLSFSEQAPNLTAPELVRIEAGTFLMGRANGETGDHEERPQHEVCIARPFAIGKYAVTFDEYDAFAEATDRELPQDKGWGRGRRPVINVSWADAEAYAQWLSEKTGKRYRLPSEAEWEYAARGGTPTRWSFGDDESDIGAYAWHDGNSGGKTHPVGEKGANPWGLHDVHGNVWEWVRDCWHDSYGGAPTDGSAWDEQPVGDSSRSALRGGSWKDTSPERKRSASFPKSAASNSVGFRVVCERKNPAHGLRVVRSGSWCEEPQRLRSVIRDRFEPNFGYNDVGFRLASEDVS